jgi:adenylate cyclase class IV
MLRPLFDRVEALGDFLEIEVVLGDTEPSENGVIEADQIMGRLGVERSQLIEGAYIDLLARGACNP